MFVVTGATGNVGRGVLAELLRRGAPVRAVVRDPARAALPDGVEAVAGDLSQPDSLAAAFHDALGAFLMPGYPGVPMAAQAAGVRRVAQLSGGSAGLGDSSNAISRYMRATETEVRESGLEWTFVRPTAFMSNALRWKEQLQDGDVVRAPFATVPLAVVDPADVGAVAATALMDDGHHAFVYRPTGPEALLPEHQVALLGQALGRTLRFEAQTNDEARRDMLATTPPEFVAAFFDFSVNGAIDETTVRPTVADVLGRPPRTFLDWATGHIDEFGTLTS